MTAPETPPPAEETPPAAEVPPVEEPSDWQAKFEAQQKVARDLERKLKSSDDNRAKVAEMEKALAAAQGKEQEFEALQSKRATEQAALAKANERILRSEIKAAAAGRLADPADALKLLDLSGFEVDDDGNVDEDAIAAAVAELVKNKPYLAAQGGKRFEGAADGGARKEGRPAQLSRDDLKRMSPEDIEKARQDGRLESLLTGK